MVLVDYLYFKDITYVEFETIADYIYQEAKFFRPISNSYRKNLKLGVFVLPSFSRQTLSMQKIPCNEKLTWEQVELT
jgi:hypothetical protein